MPREDTVIGYKGKSAMTMTFFQRCENIIKNSAPKQQN